MPMTHNIAITAVTAPTKPSANIWFDAVSTASATSAATSSAITASTPGAGQRRGASASRSNVAAGTSRARASAGTANNNATSKASSAAVASGIGYKARRGGTGSAAPTTAVTIHGTAAPTSKPAAIPPAATRPSCARKIAAIVREVAPSTFSVAMILALPARYAATPLPTPTPAIASAASPTSSRNWPNWSIPLRKPPAARSLVLAVQPAPPRRASKRSRTAFALTPRGSTMR